MSLVVTFLQQVPNKSTESLPFRGLYPGMVSDETVFATHKLSPAVLPLVTRHSFPWADLWFSKHLWLHREGGRGGSYAVLVELLCSYFSVGRVRLKGRVLSGSAPVGCVMKVGIIDIRYQWHFYNFNTFMRHQIAIHRSSHMFQHFNWIFIHRAILGTCDP